MRVIKILAAVMLLSAANAVAAPISLNATQSQTIAGQDFTFDFLGLAPAVGGGTFILHARGDYDGAADEALTWSMDSGVVTGGPVGGFLGDCAGGVGGPFDFCTVFQSLGNVEWQRTYALTPAQMSSLLADGSLSVFVDLAATVGLFDTPRYVEVTVLYESAAVPEPTTIALLGLGLAGLGARRRRQV